MFTKGARVVLSAVLVLLLAILVQGVSAQGLDPAEARAKAAEGLAWRLMIQAPAAKVAVPVRYWNHWNWGTCLVKESRWSEAQTTFEEASRTILESTQKRYFPEASDYWFQVFQNEVVLEGKSLGEGVHTLQYWNWAHSHPEVTHSGSTSKFSIADFDNPIMTDGDPETYIWSGDGEDFRVCPAMKYGVIRLGKVKIVLRWRKAPIGVTVAHPPVEEGVFHGDEDKVTVDHSSFGAITYIEYVTRYPWQCCQVITWGVGELADVEVTVQEVK